MKKLLLLLLITFLSQAGIDEVLKNNRFVDLTQKNITNIKLGAGFFIGGFALKGMLNAPHYIKQVEIDSEEKRNDLKNDLEFLISHNNIRKDGTDQRYQILTKNYDRELGKINRTEKITKGFWYTMPTLGILGSLGAIFHWYKSTK